MFSEEQRTWAEAVKRRANEMGFDLVGITGVEPSIFADAYREWVEQGFAGEMHYLTRDLHRRLDPAELLPNARSIIVVGMNYANTDNPGVPTDLAPDTAIFARYARGDDYHDVMTPRLRELLMYIKELAGEGTEGRIYVDTGPLLEREVAQRAGLGWFGKNTLLINTKRGSYFLLGEIITNVLLPRDTPALGGCGTCTRCMDACPTQAIIAPFKLDARRCISYLTIELKGAIPEEFRPAIADSGNRIFGCDICQEVCPFNIRRSVPTEEPAFQAREVTDYPPLMELMVLSEEGFREKFRKSPVKRTKRRGLLRSVATALAQSDAPEARVVLKNAAECETESLVREASEWALEQQPALSISPSSIKRQ